MQGVGQPLQLRYGPEVTVMQEMGWSWPDLLAAPHDLVEELTARLDARQHWQRERDKRDKAMAQQRAAQASVPRGRG